MRNRSIWPALVLILLGCWFLADNFGLALPDFGQLWPIFVVVGGLVSLSSYFRQGRRHADALFSGIVALGIGFYFLLFTLELTVPVLGHFEWSRMAEFWPGFVLIAGLAFLAQFVAGGFQPVRLLVAGGLIVLFAVIAFAFTLQFLSQTLARQLIVFWPIVLILIGLWLVTQRLFKRS
jgi:hypothetical protein